MEEDQPSGISASQEWKEARSMISKYNENLHDLRKYGLTFVAALLAANSVQTYFSFNNFTIFFLAIITITFIVILHFFDVYYQRMIEAVSIRTRILETVVLSNIELDDTVSDKFKQENLTSYIKTIYIGFIIIAAVIGVVVIIASPNSPSSSLLNTSSDTSINSDIVKNSDILLISSIFVWGFLHSFLCSILLTFTNSIGFKLIDDFSIKKDNKEVTDKKVNRESNNMCKELHKQLFYGVVIDNIPFQKVDKRSTNEKVDDELIDKCKELYKQLFQGVIIFGFFLIVGYLIISYVPHLTTLESINPVPLIIAYSILISITAISVWFFGRKRINTFLKLFDDYLKGDNDALSNDLGELSKKNILIILLGSSIVFSYFLVPDLIPQEKDFTPEYIILLISAGGFGIFFIDYFSSNLILRCSHGKEDWIIDKFSCRIGEKIKITVTNLNETKIYLGENGIICEILGDTGIFDYIRTDSVIELSPYCNFSWLWDTKNVEKEGIYRIKPSLWDSPLRRSVHVHENGIQETISSENKISLLK